jgi:hypothetical protein
MALKRWYIPSFDFTTIDGWTQSGSGTGEYFYTGTSINEPNYVKLEGTLAEEGTLGSLAAGTYGWGDNDTLGSNTLYVRLAGSGAPGSSAVQYFYEKQETLVTAEIGKETIILSLLISNFSYTNDAKITIEHINGVTTLFKYIIDLLATDSPFALDSKIVLDPSDAIKITSNNPDVSIIASGDAS